MLTPRTKQILLVMLKHGEVMSVKDLALKVGVSKRTIQRELEYIANSLKAYHIEFVSKTGVGVWLEGEESDKKSLLQEIEGEDLYDTSNKEDRRKRLILELLKDKGLKKLFVYSDKFKVSEATISADLEVVTRWLNEFSLDIVRKPGSGIYVDGTEKNFRKAIRSFLEENINTDLMQEAYSVDFDHSYSYDMIRRSGVGQMLDDETLKRVAICIKNLQSPHIESLTESSFIGLLIHISIAIRRIVAGEFIDSDQKWSEQFDEDGDFELAQDIVWSLEETFEIEIPEVEISYICMHIKGAKHEYMHAQGERRLTIDNSELKQLLNDMIYAFDQEKAYMLKQDDEFMQGLLAHLQPTLIRLKYDLQITNPILEGIKQDYPEVYDKCRAAAKVMEDFCGQQIPEAEIGYLTVHFGAALVRAEGKEESIRPVHVAVVCSSGIGISRLMASKLEKIFQDRIILKTYGKHDMNAYEEQKFDFCISSILMQDLGIELLRVSPLLIEEDIEAIRRLVRKYERKPSKHKDAAGVVDQMDEVHAIAMQIKKVIHSVACEYVDKKITFDGLLQNIAEQISPYEDRQELIVKSIRDRENIASQIYAEFDFALLHARTEGVTSPTFHVCLPEGLTAFEDPYFKGIHVAFVMLVPIDEQIQINTALLGHLSTMLVEDNAFLCIARAGKQEEIRDFLSVQLRKYFASYLSKYTQI
ncbi:MAG: BglG family transcription antiterminator [Lachnospiraceae bacterium]